MNLSNTALRFSGHDTFHCKEQWMLKGLHLIENQEDKNVFRGTEAISNLGVGKNMVRSIQHWLRAFGLIDENNSPTEFAELVFINDRLDPYLENEASLWLLQYFICKSHYASIFQLIFSDYFSDKATQEFSESQIFRFIRKILKENNLNSIADKTLDVDYKVFIRTYVAPIKNQKTVEDDFNVPLLSLNLIIDTGRKNEKGETVYSINKGNHNIPIEVFVFCILTEFDQDESISYDDIRMTIGSYLCLSNDKLDDLLNVISMKYKELVYKDDAGIRQLQIKKIKSDLKKNILKDYYELH